MAASLWRHETKHPPANFPLPSTRNLRFHLTSFSAYFLCAQCSVGGAGCHGGSRGHPCPPETKLGEGRRPVGLCWDLRCGQREELAIWTGQVGEVAHTQPGRRRMGLDRGPLPMVSPVCHASSHPRALAHSSLSLPRFSSAGVTRLTLRGPSTGKWFLKAREIRGQHDRHSLGTC